MSFSTPITATICDTGGCKKAATHTVYGYSRNDCQGIYCPKHATKRVKLLNELEKEDKEDQLKRSGL